MAPPPADGELPKRTSRVRTDWMYGTDDRAAGPSALVYREPVGGGIPMSLQILRANG